MPDASDRLAPASPDDLADALAFALRFEGRKQKHDAAEMMSTIVAREIVDHLERAGFNILQRPPIGGAASIGFGHKGRAPANLRALL